MICGVRAQIRNLGVNGYYPLIGLQGIEGILNRLGFYDSCNARVRVIDDSTLPDSAATRLSSKQSGMSIIVVAVAIAVIAAKHVYAMRLLKLVYAKLIEALPTRNAFHGMKSGVLRHAFCLLVTHNVVRVILKITTVSDVSGFLNGCCKIKVTCSGLVMSTREQVKAT